MRILVSGGTGLVGHDLCLLLIGDGHEVTILTRSAIKAPRGISAIEWNPGVGLLDPNQIEGFDAVVHLAGENIANKRWSPEQKDKIKSSRVDGTKLLADTIAKLQNPPKVFIQASAIGFYGDRGDEELDEKSSRGFGFLADTCDEWERASDALNSSSVRVAKLRFGVVLSPKGGALSKLLLPFQLGAGGIIGNGRQYMSWIALDDIVGVIIHTINNQAVQGPVNLVAPRPCTNHEFTKVLGKVLFRPTIFPLPGFMARIILGEMADELLLASSRVLPRKLEETGYQFLYPDLESAFRHLLAR